MMSGLTTPTSSSSSTTRSKASAWSASPLLAWTVRVVVVALPVLAAWLFVRLLSGSLYRPGGKIGLVFWAIQALVIGTVASLLVERVTRRLVPLAALLSMSLVFPDQAPSRFSIALRSGTVRQQQRRLAEVQANGLGSTESEAAERAIDLVTMLGRHDRLTRGHTERVRAYADLIAEEMGLSTSDRQMLAWGSMLHDVGKMAVPTEILNKDGRPDKEEWAILQSHPAAGREFLSPLADWLGDWVLAASEHHERWDGSGYPLGLAGAGISLAGRITSVADAYDVMTSRRSYKPSMPVAEARHELVACAGTQFDPEVVRAFLNVSLTRRWRIGPLAWLTELPSITGGATAIPSVVATSTVVAASVAVGAITAPSFPDSLAFDQAMVATTAVESSTTTFPVVDRVSLPDDSDGTVVTTTIETTTIGEDSTTSSVSESSTTSSPVSSSTTQSPTTSSPVSSSPTTGSTTSSTTRSSTTTTTRPTTSSTTTTTQPTTTTTSAPATTTTQAATTTTVGSGLALNDDSFDASGFSSEFFVLSNDENGGSGFDLETLEITVAPSHALFKWVQDDHIRYVPAPGYEGADYLEYRVCNNAGACDTAGVTITVTGG